MFKYNKGFIIAGVVVLVLIVSGAASWSQITGFVRHYFYRGTGAVSQLGTVSNKLGNVQQAEQCRQVMTLIQNAKKRGAQDHQRSVGEVSWEEVIVAMHPELGRGGHLSQAVIAKYAPRCPAGGTYTLGTLEEVPRCSIGSNNTLPSQDDHTIHF